jgi:hypothetical protein
MRQRHDACSPDRAPATGVNVLHLGGNVRDVNKDRDRTEVIGTVGLAFTY